jgi:hypothetical protein
MAEKTTAGSSGAAAGKEAEIDDLLKHLELHDDELDDVVIEADAVKEYQKEARWLAIGKVHTSRSFSAEALFGKMKVIWNLSKDPICREAGENLFIFQMHCLGDWKKVVHQGPWTFRGWVVLVEDYDGREDPEKVIFKGLYVWAQIHGIPELYRKTEVIDDLACRVGKAKETQMSPKLYHEGNYVRIRVLIDIAKPLMRFVSLSVQGEGRKRLAVKYEKLPFFCKRCRLLGHDHEECGDGMWEAKDLQYGEWMLAVRRASVPVEPRRFAPRALVRGGSASRGGLNPKPKKRSSQEALLDDEEEIGDSGESPLKSGPMEGVEDDKEYFGARKKLDLGPSENVNVEKSDSTTEIDKELGTPPPPPGYTNQRDRTKQRRT